MKVASKKQIRENLPLGRHNAQVVEVSSSGIEFELTDGDQRGIRMSYKAPKLIHPKSHFGRSVEILRGYCLQSDEQLDLSDLVGKRCSIRIGLEDGEKVVVGVAEELHGKPV